MSSAPNFIGKVIDNRYEVLEKIGQGGFGEVYKARHLRMDRTVALKLLRLHLAGEEEYLKRFEQEAKAASRINHPNAVAIYDFGQAEEGVYYIAMEFVQGVSLKQVLRESAPLPPERVVQIIKQICGVLAEAHHMGVVHRDIKPENIMLSKKGAREDIVKVLDFGIAKIISEDASPHLTQTGVAFGTPRYMSPEQCEGKPVDWRADIYALGCIIYEMITGRPPFDGELATVMIKHVTETPMPLRQAAPAQASVTEELERVVLQALQKEREKRQSAEELARGLEQAITVKVSRTPLQTPAVPTPPLPPPPPPRPPGAGAQIAQTLQTEAASARPRSIVPALLVISMLLLLAVAGIVAYRYRGRLMHSATGATTTSSSSVTPPPQHDGQPPPSGQKTTAEGGATGGGVVEGGAQPPPPAEGEKPTDGGSHPPAAEIPEYQRLSNEAIGLARSGQADQAQHLLATAIQQKPDSPEVHYNLAQVLILQNRYAESAEELKIYLRLLPNAPDRAAVESKLRELDAARENEAP